MKRYLIVALFLSFLLQAAPSEPIQKSQSGELLVLCYHSIQPQVRVKNDYTISQNLFAQQMDYLRTHEYKPVSLKDVVAAYRGGEQLPSKAVMLTFDDAYQSYANFVVPLLSCYGFPSMVAVVGSWIEHGPPSDLPEPLLTWSQLKQLSTNPLVTIASHSYDLHRAVQYTPQGNVGALVGVRAYSNRSKSYESETVYRDKLRLDFKQQEKIFFNRLNLKPTAMVWPYGHYNAIALETAKSFGLNATFALDEKGNIRTPIDHLEKLNRMLILNEPIDRFIFDLDPKPKPAAPIRAVQVDLDLIYSEQSAQETDRNLGRLIERLLQLKVNTVFLQAFADPDGTGNISKVYFRNRYLPVRADIFAHAVHQIKIRGMKVYAWMPVLSYEFPDPEFNQRAAVRRYGLNAPNSSDYQRLSPFSPDVQKRIAGLFEDLAQGSQISGVLYQDDAFLSDDEDFHPTALAAFKKTIGHEVDAKEILPGASMAEKWMQFKTQKLIDFTMLLSSAVRRHRPEALFARNLYARLLVQPEAETWFAQNFDRFIDAYDYVVVMAYPQMEHAEKPAAWLQKLATIAGRTTLSGRKTIFKLQTYDWRTNRWLSDSLILKEMRAVLASGIRHLAYYPDSFWENKPDIHIVRQEMSTLSRIDDE